MVITKSAVLNKLAELKAYSVSRKPSVAGLFAGVEAAVEEYFSAGGGYGTVMSEIVQFMYFDIARRNTVYEHQFDLGLRTDFPVGYYDVGECFYQFPEIMSVSNLQFYNAFTLDEMGLLTNPYLTSWQEVIPLQGEQDAQRLNALNEWCQNSGGNADLVSLLEDQGRVVSAMAGVEIAREIYLNRNVKKIIVDRNLSVYIPTYL